jgi:hypothetical protein
MSAANRRARNGNRLLVPSPRHIPAPAATNVPCDFCERRGHLKNPVRFRIDVPGFCCNWCHDQHVTAKLERARWTVLAYSIAPSPELERVTMWVDGVQIGVVTGDLVFSPQ